MTDPRDEPFGRRLARTAGGLLVFYGVGMTLTLVLALGGSRLLAFALPAPDAPPDAVAVLLQGVVLLAAFGIASLVVARWFRGRIDDWGYGGTMAVRGFAGGLALAGILAACALLLAVIAGGARWTPDAGTGLEYARTVLLTAGTLAPAALAEEVMFRGVPLVLLASLTGTGTALVLLAALFAALHGANPNVTPLALGNIALAGVFLGLAFYAPGRLWTAWGAHLGWNGTLAALDAPVSGLPFRVPLLDFQPGAPDWLTGGAFGPEGGLVATAVLAFGCLLLGLRAGKVSTA